MKLPTLLGAAWALSVFAACDAMPRHQPGGNNPTGAAGHAAAGTGATRDGGAGNGPAGMSGPGGTMMTGMGIAGMAGTAAPEPADAATDEDTDGGTDAEPPPASSCPTETRDGGTAAPAGCRVSTVPSKGCAVAKTAIVPGVLCAGSATCPVTAAARLSCELGFNDSQISLAPRADGASIIANLYDLDGDGFLQNDTQLFTVSTTGASRVDQLRDVPYGLIAADRAGGRHFFVGAGEGGWHLRETTGAWVREDFKTDPPLPSAYILAQVADEAHAIVAVGTGEGLSLGSRDENGWKFSPVPELRPTHGLAFDVGADGRAWLASGGRHGDDVDHTFLDVVSPDRKHETMLQLDGDSEGFVTSILADGLSGKDARPAVAYRRNDGIHIATPAAGAAWSHRLVPGSAELVFSTTCPVPGEPLLNCGIATCDEHATGSGASMGLARTPSGAFVVWVDVDMTTVHKLDRDPTCGIGAQGCVCTTGELLGQSGSVAVAVARVPADPAATLQVQRFTFRNVPFGSGMVALSTRGNTLLVAAAVQFLPVDIRYLEIDSTKLP